MVQPWAALLLPLRQIIVCRIESAGLGCAGDVGAGGADVDAVVGGGCWPARRDPAAVHRHTLPGRHQLRSGGSDGHQDGAGGPPQRAGQLGHQLRRPLQLEDGHLLLRRLRLRLRIAQSELVREIVTRHWQPHQATICAVTEQCDFWPHSQYHRKVGDAKDS